MDNEINKKRKELWNSFINNWQKNSTSPAYDYFTSELNHYLESKKLFKRIELKKDFNILDIGAGSGRWTYDFSKKCKKVVSVEPFAIYYQLKKRIKDDGLNNVNILKKGIEELNIKEKFDIVIISGVFVYFEDNEVKKILYKNINPLLKKGGILILREYISNKKEIRSGDDGLEISRNSQFWLNNLKKDYKLNNSFLSHTPFFIFHLSKKSKFFKKIQKIFYNKKLFFVRYLFDILTSPLFNLLNCILKRRRTIIFIFEKL